ncbi:MULTISPECIES: SAF domain-containing protein [Methylobacterium]|jgi:predicted homoserine dehydrogenase-like protein|uniref:NAD(P)H-dependent oxidoreductase n=1 Tax=Methylobacterium TaxID=407 RepID=UPI0008F3655A|nr:MULTISPECIES: SAF domain-containing protein [Methylobacterium]MBZ6415877.1 SAF domain-containing protein [Methylobacterium sp.]MBK3396406.1 flagellar biosynthesis protein FlgA [Methylobacterium ajmalii]MBK3410392.1 flagellar biosynthesis protein FlgA [Methylobacterium ajmalii]MBK3420852.1 flagellar biosynthesis protein FlgA [Methylobacterium ajmalii]SFF52601.1 Predicted homoserine dehydrogenase, contains C-terminal SAF domain [Methylobacterium sp. yr596]
MSLYHKLAARAEAGNPVRIGVIGAGKFGSMFLSQAPRTPGLHVVGIADLDPQRARSALARVDWPAERYGARSVAEALRESTTFITDDAEGLIASDGIEVIVEATGHPGAGIRHALACCRHKRHIVMVNVEADALAGPLIARRAAEAGIVYSFAYGDQPALIAEIVDWARTAGFRVVCAGKGTKYLPVYHASTPDTVWGHYGFTEEQVAGGDFNPQMFNSFLDGTKSALEMAAVANACELTPPPAGLAFPACGVDDLPTLLRPRSAGGILPVDGTVEVVSSLERDGRPVFRDLRWGVYATFEAPSDYVRKCFAEYGLKTDPSGRYSAMYKPYHLIGLELGLSVASIAVRAEPTGTTRGFSGDVVATAKRDLKAGERLDGEGGYTVYGRLMPARDSLAAGGLPIGLAHGLTLTRPVAAGQPVAWDDVSFSGDDPAIRFRREMEDVFRGEAGAA